MINPVDAFYESDLMGELDHFSTSVIDNGDGTVSVSGTVLYGFKYGGFTYRPFDSFIRTVDMSKAL